MLPQRSAPRSPEPGDVIAGKYRLTRPVGLGAMGLVFEATHLRMQQRVAIKFMQSQLVADPDAVARFEREGRAASRLTSPHATRIFDVDTTEDGVPYIVSELLEGRDLRQELDEVEKLPIEDAVGYVIQACVVMAEAHSFGIVHRDLKPSNLFLAKTSMGRIVKVLDFGISKMDEELELTTTGIQLGSPRYMSPEQVEAKPVDRRADIWALGVILFRAISGSFPFEGNTSISLAVAIMTKPPRDLVSLVPDVPRGLVHAINKALDRNVATRHATARDFAESLAPFASPEAAALVKTLTHEVREGVPSKPTLNTSGADADTVARPMNEVIEVSLEAPEQATRGTWAQPSTFKKLRPKQRTARKLGVMAAMVALPSAIVAAFIYNSAIVSSPPAALGRPVEAADAATRVASPDNSQATPPQVGVPQVPAPPSDSASVGAPATARPTKPSQRPQNTRPAVTDPVTPPPTTKPRNPTYL
jgi:serine/threonine protein kinase